MGKGTVFSPFICYLSALKDVLFVRFMRNKDVNMGKKIIFANKKDIL